MRMRNSDENDNDNATGVVIKSETAVRDNYWQRDFSWTLKEPTGLTYFTEVPANRKQLFCQGF